jgi:outer membrane lipoprotein SlyB
MMVRLGLGAAGMVLLLLAGCGPDYSPNTYSSNAVQQANKVEKGVIVGVRPVGVSASGTAGAVAGAAAGGVIGGTAGDGTVSKALGALGGTVVGGLVGTGVEHAAGDTSAWEYIVRKTNGEFVSVTQKDEKKPLPVGQKVLVIAGNQARIVPDYTVAVEPESPAKEPLPAQLPASPALVTPVPGVQQEALPQPAAPPLSPAPQQSAQPEQPAQPDQPAKPTPL